MASHVAFLRAINVTGRFVKMTALASAFHRLGHDDARTYINSGNVIFTSVSAAADLERQLEASLEAQLGFKTEVFLRTVDDLQRVVNRARALCPRVGDSGEVNVCFLQSEISPAQSAEILTLSSDVDGFECDGREVYWMCQTRQSGSKLSNAVLERKLKARSTLRRVSMLEGLFDVL